MAVERVFPARSGFSLNPAVHEMQNQTFTDGASVHCSTAKHSLIPYGMSHGTSGIFTADQ
jgi:hypothetical protein